MVINYLSVQGVGEGESLGSTPLVVDSGLGAETQASLRIAPPMAAGATQPLNVDDASTRRSATELQGAANIPEGSRNAPFAIDGVLAESRLDQGQRERVAGLDLDDDDDLSAFLTP